MTTLFQDAPDALALVTSEAWLCPICNHRGNSHMTKCFVFELAREAEGYRRERDRAVGGIEQERHKVNAMAEALRLHKDEISATREVLREFDHVEGEPLRDVAQVAVDAFHHGQAASRAWSAAARKEPFDV